jgi:hypothetical protein
MHLLDRGIQRTDTNAFKGKKLPDKLRLQAILLGDYKVLAVAVIITCTVCVPVYDATLEPCVGILVRGGKMELRLSSS